MTISSHRLLITDDGTKDVRASLASTVSSGTLYAGFDVRIDSNDLPSSTTTDGYFAHFKSAETGNDFLLEGAGLSPLGNDGWQIPARDLGDRRNFRELGNGVGPGHDFLAWCIRSHSRTLPRARGFGSIQ